MAEFAIELRSPGAGDLHLIEALQSSAPEAAHWPPADYLVYPTLLAIHHNAVLGLVCWRTVADETELLNLVVDPAFRRRGIARALVSQVPGPLVFLEVRESNTAAQKLYQTLGFQQVGERPGYYRNPTEKAIVMVVRK